MAGNNSVNDGLLLQPLTPRNIVVQILVIIFLCINMLLIVTIFKKECFHTSARYILFSVTLLSDSLLLLMSDILLILTVFKLTLQVWLCTIITLVVSLYSTITPVTLTAMTLERYVAICMPLHHGQLCSTRSTVYCILIIHGLSSGPCIVILSMFFASASLSFYKQYMMCSVESFILYRWHDHVRSAVNQFYFLIMGITIVFSYVKIMKVAKAASGENKKSTHKGLRTVVLHAFQLLLCLIQLWTPFIETAVLQIDFNLFMDVRFFNYISFCIAPRCLSPLIYGLRDEKIFLELKNYAYFILFKISIT
ncbi:LOW QUALITY PROTEIN: odorant receptor 131-2-like [Archocentrus centrarchus]|uniref:LOW QUALITY PROTEIN: odorant receptor 131-2-like n=1 Tax=Archocentrus centrarchus TaxID=63155 RepID=UPI0011E9C0AC|nr:LOW QUALITY PROTEIN: odorant receptor 131-2-like [Archocentrus centrarchus]